MTDLRVVRWARPSTKSASDAGWRPAIARPGTKWIQMVHFHEGSVVVSKIPIGEERFFQSLLYHGNEYPLRRAAKIYLRRKGRVTKAAKAILKEALGQ